MEKFCKKTVNSFIDYFFVKHRRHGGTEKYKRARVAANGF
jgi:hypothetical protein